MIDAGGNNEHLRPLNQDGNAFADAVGSHRGTAEDLNVMNPVPGMLYYWCRNEQSSLRRFLRFGWEVVPPDSPERKFVRDPDYTALGLDGIQTNKDVVLLRIPEQLYRRLADHRGHKRKVALEGSTEDYLGRNSDYDHWAATAEGPILYRGRNHAAVQLR